MQLADLPGVPGHEWRVREAIMAALPPWARRVAVVDSIGNLIVTAGPDRDPIAFLAHMDEVAFEVDRVLPDGRVTLRRMGGVVVSNWEGVPALLHFDRGGDAPASLRGLFVPRDSGRTRTPPQLTAWFGMDSAQLVAAGVRIARAASIPLQVGTTQGGVDGGAIVPWGAPNIGLSWPGRYSHGPAEVLDLRDVAALARLIRAVALGNE